MIEDISAPAAAAMCMYAGAWAQRRWGLSNGLRCAIECELIVVWAVLGPKSHRAWHVATGLASLLQVHAQSRLAQAGTSPAA